MMGIDANVCWLAAGAVCIAGVAALGQVVLALLLHEERRVTERLRRELDRSQDRMELLEGQLAQPAREGRS